MFSIILRNLCIENAEGLNFVTGGNKILTYMGVDENFDSRNELTAQSNKRRVLIVTAHPDDECMFFGPSILHFTQREKALVYVICLSNGNHYGQGKVRQQELWNSCLKLGVQKENIYLFRCDDLPDDPSIVWPTVHTANLINQYIHALDIDMVVTFDLNGVSGHVNHQAVYSSVQHLVEEDLLPEECEAYSVDTVNIFRKYCSFIDVPLSYALSSCAFTVDRKQYSLILEAMKAHNSQYVWYRKLYMVFSRYVLINTLSRITAYS
ncbi:unnamed protein product, partial [Meganyctiphanes norvegica]